MKVFGLAGYSGSGKTTLLEKLLPVFTARGLTVSLIKHTHHEVDVDRPGKDSWRLRQAGCTQVLLSSETRWALMHELRGAPEPTLDEQLARLSPVDLVLIEGFKATPVAKLEIHRPDQGRPLLYPDTPHIVAIASDSALQAPLPVLDLNDTAAIAGFILAHTGLDV